jgi:hypothetical protein
MNTKARRLIRPALALEALRRTSSGSWMRRALATATVVVVGGSASVLACPLCFGAEETGVVDATRWGIIALLAVTLLVQGAFVAFFLYLRRRARQIADLDLDLEWSQLQGGASRS